ncbi:unnamed protein product [Caenorhabditis sp. 36 PRJEB53466]|nr:unnamed protein product [Caenorhabditis sp. 36 PRJEB53466]
MKLSLNLRAHKRYITGVANVAARRLNAAILAIGDVEMEELPLANAEDTVLMHLASLQGAEYDVANIDKWLENELNADNNCQKDPTLKERYRDTLKEHIDKRDYLTLRRKLGKTIHKLKAIMDQGKTEAEWKQGDLPASPTKTTMTEGDQELESESDEDDVFVQDVETTQELNSTNPFINQVENEGEDMVAKGPGLNPFEPNPRQENNTVINLIEMTSQKKGIQVDIELAAELNRVLDSHSKRLRNTEYNTLARENEIINAHSGIQNMLERNLTPKPILKKPDLEPSEESSDEELRHRYEKEKRHRGVTLNIKRIAQDYESTESEPEKIDNKKRERKVIKGKRDSYEHLEESDGEFTLPVKPFELPKFSGRTASEYEEWKEMFNAAYGRNKRLMEIQKLIQLKTHVSDYAKSVIGAIQLEKGNYERAWEVLDATFASKSDTVDELFSSFLKATINHKDFTKMLCDTGRIAGIVENLKNRGVNVDNIAFTKPLIAKLPENIQRKIMTTMEINGHDGTFRTMYQWIQREIVIERNITANLENNGTLKKSKDFEVGSADDTEINHSEIKTNNKFQNKKGNRAKQSSQTEGGQPGITGSDNDDCIFGCTEQHQYWKCPKPIKQKYFYAKENKLCYICFSKEHRSGACSYKNGCKHCKGPHNSILHASFEYINNKRMSAQQQNGNQQVNSPQFEQQQNTNITWNDRTGRPEQTNGPQSQQRQQYQQNQTANSGRPQNFNGRGNGDNATH